MEDIETGEDNAKTKWPGYCQTFIVKEPNGNIKELVFPKALDLDRPKRERTTFSNRQLQHLEEEFNSNQYIVGKDRTRLAKSLGLSETQVKVWFQNRRTKLKKDNERKESLNDPQAESKAAQNVLKLLSFRTNAAYPNFHNRLSHPPSILEAVLSPPRRETSTPELRCQGAQGLDESFTASSLGDDNSIEVSADGNVLPPMSAVHFPLSASGVSSAVTDPAVTMQSNYSPVAAMNCGLSQAKNYDHFGVSPATSFCPREFDPSVRDGSIIGHQQEMLTFNALTNDPRHSAKTMPLGYPGNVPAYYRHAEAAMPQFANLPCWLDDYQRMNLLKHSKMDWHQNRQHVSHPGAPPVLHVPGGIRPQHHPFDAYANMYTSGQSLQQPPLPAGLVWRYIHPAQTKKGNFQTFPNHLDGR
ncbi:uncharacterized protein LOC106079502 [Biomphalaria glabrata]|uniref:Uncharacterized protein LOC106079502 n=1 Tax=Biomphalaria glabrata TaxID=6526 RepID=A0A9U8ENC0_BIOGL|nr:uncharacterized protein LOC106079502 [Biomphalaria glabrata]